MDLYIHGIFENFVKPTTETTIGTMQAIWRILKWSFTAIWNGTWPSVDAWGRKCPPSSVDGRRAGQQLANGYYGCLVQLCGDLDYYATIWASQGGATIPSHALNANVPLKVL